MEYRATVYLEYRASSCISVKQQAIGNLVWLLECRNVGMLSSYGKDAFMGRWEKLRRQTLFASHALTLLAALSKLQS